MLFVSRVNRWNSWRRIQGLPSWIDSWVGGPQSNMKSMWPLLAAISFMTYFTVLGDQGSRYCGSINACDSHRFQNVSGFGRKRKVFRHHLLPIDGDKKPTVTMQISWHQFLDGHWRFLSPSVRGRWWLRHNLNSETDTETNADHKRFLLTHPLNPPLIWHVIGTISIGVSTLSGGDRYIDPCPFGIWTQYYQQRSSSHCGNILAKS